MARVRARGERGGTGPLRQPVYGGGTCGIPYRSGFFAPSPRFSPRPWSSRARPARRNPSSCRRRRSRSPRSSSRTRPSTSSSWARPRASEDIDIRARVDGLPRERGLQGGERGQEGRPPLHHRPAGVPGEGGPGQGPARTRPRPCSPTPKSSCERIKPLAAISAVSQRDLDNAEARVGSAQGEVDAARAHLAGAGAEPQLHAHDLPHRRHHREDQGQGGRVRGPPAEPHDPEHGLQRGPDPRGVLPQRGRLPLGREDLRRARMAEPQQGPRAGAPPGRRLRLTPQGDGELRRP